MGSLGSEDSLPAVALALSHYPACLLLSPQGCLSGQFSMAPAYFYREPGVSFGSLVEYPSFETEITWAGVKFVSAFPVGTWPPPPSPSTP